MSRERGNKVGLFSCCQHATQNASTSSKATEEISLALTTKLFTLDAKKVSVRKAGRGQCSSPGWSPLREATSLEILCQIRGKQWRKDYNKKQHETETQVLRKAHMDQ